MQHLASILLLCGGGSAAAALTGFAARPSVGCRAPHAAMVAPVAEDTTTMRPDRVRVSHILIDSEEMAETVVETINSGKTFEEVAETVSSCGSAAQGGDLGWITPGLMVPEFDAAAFFFPVGELATVKSEFGWHVVRVAEASYVPTVMEPSELKERLDDADIQLIDLRGDEELEQAPLLPGFRHLPYVKWQTWAEDALEGKLEPPIRRDVESVFLDHRGGRGERIMQYFAQNGFSKARWVRGGINSYSEEADPSVPTYLESDGDCLTCHEH